MELVNKGKTKDVYDLGNGRLLLKFKDDVTVDEQGKFDPGGNKTGLTVKGVGNMNLRLTDFFFKKIAEAKIATHYISGNLEENTMTVKAAEFFGKGLEIICRFRATGSFIRRYGSYVEDGKELPAFVEFCIKDDDRGDPIITKEGLEVLGILTDGEYDKIVSLTRKICTLVKDELAAKGAELYDIKLEFGRCDGEIILIDEISGGSMRVYKNGVNIAPSDIVNLVLP